MESTDRVGGGRQWAEPSAKRRVAGWPRTSCRGAAPGPALRQTHHRHRVLLPTGVRELRQAGPLVRVLRLLPPSGSSSEYPRRVHGVCKAQRDAIDDDEQRNIHSESSLRPGLPLLRRLGFGPARAMRECLSRNVASQAMSSLGRPSPT